MTISLCMIGKNNESTIERCLRSVVDVVDELIFVDTGSTDKTILVVEGICESSDLPFNIIIHPWEDDFAKARNAGLVRATCSLILWLDTDDEVPVETREAIRIIRQANDLKAAYYLNIHNVNVPEIAREWQNDFPQLKIFPNMDEITFKGRIHESVEEDVKNLPIEIRHVDYAINHHGYTDEKTLEEKLHRNLRISTIKEFEKQSLPSPVAFYQFRIENYFFLYIPNVLRMYGNQFVFEAGRTLIMMLKEKNVFSNRNSDFTFGDQEKFELIDLAAKMYSEYQKDEINPLVDEMERLRFSIRQSELNIIPKMEVAL